MKTPTTKHTLYASYLGYITQAIINNLAPLLFITFQTRLHIRLELIALLITINFGVQIITDILAAKYADHIGYRPLVVLAHILSSLGLLGLGVLPYLLSNAYLGIVISVILYAIGGGLIEVLISPIVEALPNEQKEQSMSLLHSFYCWGQVGVVLLSTLYFAMVGITYWYYLPILFAILPLANGILFTQVPLYVLHQDIKPIPVSRLFRMKLFYLFVLIMICAGASEQAMSQWASYFAESGLQVGKTMGDLLGPCSFAIMMGLSRLFYGKFGHQIPLKKFMYLSGFLCILSYLLVVSPTNPILSLLGCSLCGLSVGIMWPGTFSLAANTCPGGGTAMFALFALAGDIGCAVGPTIVGQVSSMSGNLKTGLLVACLFPILLVIGLSFLREKAK